MQNFILTMLYALTSPDFQKIFLVATIGQVLLFWSKYTVWAHVTFLNIWFCTISQILNYHTFWVFTWFGNKTVLKDNVNNPGLKSIQVLRKWNWNKNVSLYFAFNYGYCTHAALPNKNFRRDHLRMSETLLLFWNYKEHWYILLDR